MRRWWWVEHVYQMEEVRQTDRRREWEGRLRMKWVDDVRQIMECKGGEEW